MDLTNISAEDIVNGSQKIILGLCWRLILKYQITSNSNSSKTLENDSASRKRSKTVLGEEVKSPPPTNSNVKKELLEWLQKQVKDYGLKPTDLTNSFKDGKVLRALVHSLKGTGTPDKFMETINDDTPMDRNAQAINLAEEKMDIPPLVDANDVTNNPEELSMMTYLSYFRDYQVEHPGVDAEKSELVLSDLIEKDGHLEKETPVLVGDKSTFTLIARDKNGNLIKNFDGFDIKIEGAHKIVPEVTIDEDGSTLVSFTSSKTGNYNVTVTVGDQIIGKGQYSFECNEVDVCTFVAQGQGLIDGKKEVPAKFIFAKKNEFGAIRQVSKRDIKVVVEGPYPIHHKMVANEDGSYDILYTPKLPGKHKIDVSLGQKKVQGSPFEFVVRSGLDHSKVTVEGFGIKEANLDQTSRFTITSRDNNGDIRSGIIDAFNIEIDGASKIPVHVSNIGDGTYDIVYTPKTVGKYKVRISSEGTEIKGSPFNLVVKDGADPTKTSAGGSGLKSVITGETTKFTIIAKDKANARRQFDYDEFDIEFSGPQTIIPIVTSNKDGSYDVSYTAKVCGKYKIAVSVGGKEIMGSPFAVDVKSGADPYRTTVQMNKKEKVGPCSFLITSRDKLGNVRSTLLDQFNVTINGSEPTRISPKRDGTYLVEYVASKAVDTTINVSVEDIAIQGSPFNVQVSDHADASKSLIEGPGLIEGRTGERCVFTVTPRDSLGNVSQNPEKISCKILGTRDDITPKITSNYNGTWNVEYLPLWPGEYAITVLIGGSQVGSILIVPIKSGADSSKTFVVGPQTVQRTANSKNIFKLCAKDRDGNLRTAFDEFQVDIKGDGAQTNIIPLKNGNYDLEFIATNVGVHQMHISVDGKEISTSPIQIDVVQGADPKSSSVEGLKEGRTGEKNKFLVIPKSKNGDVSMLTDDLQVDFTGDEPVDSKIISNKGSFEIEYVPKRIGSYKATILLNGQEIQGSPFSIQVVSGADPVRSTFEANFKSLSLGEVASFLLTPRGKKGEDRIDFDDNFKINVDGASNPTSTITSNGDGTSTVLFSPLAVGKHQVSVSINGSELKGSPFAVDVKPSASLTSTLISGDGIKNGITGRLNKFKISAKDKDSKNRPKGADVFSVAITSPPQACPIDIQSKMDGSYEITYLPMNQGQHTIYIYVNGKLVLDPFYPMIQSGTDAFNSIAFGKGLKDGNKQGNQTAFSIKTLDSDGKVIHDPTDQFTITVDPPTKILPDTKNKSGIYDVSYNPQQQGSYAINLASSGQEFLQSPFNLVVKSSADRTKTTVDGPGLTQALIHKENKFTITSRGKDGRLRSNWTDEFKVDLYGPEKVPVQIIPNGDATYSVLYTPCVAGSYQIKILLDGDEIQGPFSVLVAEGPDLKQTQCSGEGIKGPLKSGDATKFVITSCDKFGKPRTGSTDDFVVQINGPEPTLATIKPLGNATYEVSYTPFVNGNYKVAVLYNHQNVDHSPFDVSVVSGADAQSSSIDGSGIKDGGKVGDHCQFTITARDTKQLVRKNSEDAFGVKVEGPAICNVNILPQSNGNYLVTWIPMKSGAHLIHVTLDGKQCKSSPFKVNIVEGAFAMACTAVGDGLKDGNKTGYEASFVITSKNKDGSIRSSLVDVFEVNLSGPEDIKGSVVSTGNATYKGTFVPRIPGKYDVNVTHAGKSIRGSPFDIEVKSGCEPTTTFATGLGIKDARLDVSNKFIISSNDKSGKLRKDCIDSFVIKMDGTKMDSIITSQKDGTYLVEYSTTRIGKHLLHVVSEGNEISGSPFNVVVSEGADPIQSLADGQGLRDGNKSGLKTEFTLTLKDETGKLRPRESDDVKIEIVGQDENPTPHINHRDENILVEYTPKHPGKHSINIFVNGKRLMGSPIAVHVKSGADPYKSYLDPISEAKVKSRCKFAIFAKNRKGEPFLDGENEFLVDVDGPGYVKTFVKSNSNGTCSCEMIPPLVGKYNVTVSLNGVEIKGSPFEFNATLNADAQRSSVEGEGLSTATTGLDSKFFIYSRDAQGRIRSNETDVFDLDVNGPENNHIKVSPVDSGLYKVNYTPLVSGKYTVGVKVNGQEVKGSQFKVDVISAADIQFTIAEGPGLKSGIKCGTVASFVVITKDSNNKTRTESDDVQVIIEGPLETVPNIKCNNDGTYAIDYTPQSAGKNRVHVMVNGNEIKNSPFDVVVVSGADCYNTTVEGSALKTGGRPDIPARFTITSRDRNGDIRDKFIDEFQVKVTGPSPVVEKIVSNGNGTYDVQFTPTQLGNYHVEVLSNGRSIRNCPFDILVVPCADPSKTTCEGNGIKDGNATGDTPTFTITCRDVDGKQRTVNDDIQVSFEGPGKVEHELIALGNGTYHVEYKPKTPGDYKISVTLDGKNVKDAPFHVNILPGADPTKSYCEGPGLIGGRSGETLLFTIVSNDKAGNKRAKSNDEFEVVIEGPVKTEAKVTSNGDGTYGVEYVPKKPGKYTVKVKLHDVFVTGTPVDVPIKSGADPLKCFAEGSGLCNNTKTGKPANFRITAKDLFGNNRIYEDSFEISINGPEKLEAQVISHGDGTYDVMYHPKIPGKYAIDITLDGQKIKTPHFDVNIVLPADPTRTTVEGTGLGEIETAVTNKFKVCPRDKNGVPVLPVEGSTTMDEFKFDFDGPDSIDPIITIDKNGCYNVEYVANRPGLYTVGISTDGQDILGSPFIVTCVSGANADNSYAQGSGLVSSKVGTVSKFKIYAIDKNGQPRPDGVDEFGIDFDGPDAIVPKVTPAKGGIYDVEYIAKEKGKYLIGITVGDKDIKDSPYFVDIHAGFDASKTIAEGRGLQNGIKADKVTQFIVIPHDADGNPILIIPENDDEGLMVAIDGPCDAPVNIVQNEDGVYTVEYLPKDAGKYKIRIAINGEEIKDSPFSVIVAPWADANTTTAEGPGLVKGRPNIPNKFKITPRDKDGNLIPSGEDDVRIEIEGVGEVTHKIKPQDDGTYDIEYVPSKDGRYRIKIFINDKQLKSSPYVVQVKPGADPLRTTADGPGLRSGLRSNRPTEFTIVSRDREGKIRKELDEFDIIISAPIVPQHVITPNNDGTYKVFYTPLVPGDYKISIKVDEQDISKSPFKFEITPGADPNLSYCEGKGLKEASSGDKNFFKIIAIDKNGQRRPSGEDEFIVSLDGPSKCIVKVSPLTNGEYEVCYIPKRPGDYQIFVAVDGKFLKNVPFNVDCVLGADPDRCYAEGPGLYSAKQGAKTHFTIYAKDAKGNDRFGDDEFDIEFDGPGPVHHICTPFKDGTYDVEYIATTPGKHMISIQLDGNDIRKAPFFVDVSQEVDYERTIAEGQGVKNGIKPGRNAKFTVMPRDYNGTPMMIQEHPGEDLNTKEFFAEIEQGPVATKLKIVPQVNGSFLCDYTPSQPGKYKIRINVLELELKASPYVVNVTPFADPNKCSAEGRGLRIPRPNLNNKFIITLRDKDGNLLPPGDDEVTVEIYDGPVAVEAKLVQNEDGTWSATWNPSMIGLYKIKVCVDGKPIKGSSFEVNVKLGPDPHMTTAEGPGLGDGLRPGDIAWFTITSRNSDGTERVDEEDEFDVEIDGPLRAPVKIVHTGGAKYDVAYIPKIPGIYTVDVIADENHIHDSPFQVLIDQGADPFNTRVDGEGLKNPFSGNRNYFTIYPKDKDGQDRPSNTDDFTVHFDGPGKVHTQVTPNDDSTYTVEFIPRRMGYFKCRVLVGGEDINQSPLDIDVKLGAYPPLCTLQGSGLTTASVDVKSVFTIHARDVGGKDRFGFDDFDIDIEVNDDKIKCPMTITPHPNGTYTIEYTPQSPGQYLFGVTLAEQDIDGSPFFVDVKNTLDPNKTIVSGLRNGIKPNREHVFNIIPVDTRGNPFFLIDILPDNVEPGDEIEVKINGVSPTVATILPKEDGSYDIFWTPKLVGKYNIKTALLSQELKGSPFEINVTPFADPTKTLVEGYGVKVGRPDVVNRFKIIPKDKNGMNLPLGDDEIVVIIDGTAKIVPTIKPQMDGSYDVEYIPNELGPYNIRVMVNKDQNVLGSPFKIEVKYGADPNKCTAEGPGLRDDLYPGRVAKFVITSRDRYGKIRKDEIDDFEVTIHTPKGDIPCKISANNNGTYNVEYKPFTPGQHQVVVGVDGYEIKHSPFFVQVVEAADPNKSFMDGPGLVEAKSGNVNTFLIHARDKNGNKRPPKADFFDVEIDGPGSVQIELNANDDGTYTVNYIPSRPGVYKIKVGVAGQDLKQSPVTVVAQPSVDPIKSYVEGSGLYEAKVAQVAQFKIFAFDFEGKPRLGHDDFDVSVTGLAPVHVDISPNPDGTYDCSYIPKVRGNHIIKVAIDGKDLKGSEFTVEVKGLDPTARAEGDGLYNAKEKEISTFFIISNNQLKLDPQDFEVEIDGPAVVAIRVNSESNGSLKVDYEPKMPGLYKIMIDQKGTSPLLGCPFVINVKPGVDATKTIVRGLDTTPITGEKSQFIIEAKDKNGAPYISIKDFTKDIDEFKVDINGVLTNVPCRIIPNDDGTYICSWVPQKNGKYQLDVLAGGQEVKGSPFQVEARGADPSKSTCEGPGLIRAIEQEWSPFVLTARDKEGKKRMHDDDVKIKVEGPSKVEVKVETKGNGIYEIEYKPAEAGKYKIRCFIDDVEIKQCPIEINVETRADPSKCTFNGPDQLIAEEPSKFIIGLKDAAGKFIPYRPNRIKLFVDGSQDPEPLTSLGNGLYEGIFIPKKPGRGLLRAQVDGKDFGSIDFEAKPKISARHTLLKFNSPNRHVPFESEPVKLAYTVIPKDVNGNLVRNAPLEAMSVEIVDLEGNKMVPKIAQNNDGSFDIAFTTKVPSVYTATVKMDGNNVRDSPMEVSVGSVLDPDQTTSDGPGLKKCYPDHQTMFTITAKDQNGIPIIKGGHDFDVEVYGPDNQPIKAPIIVDDLGNGKYQVYYTPNVEGPHKIEVYNNEKPIKCAPYFVNSKSKLTAPDPNMCFVKKPRKPLLNTKTTFTVVLLDKDGNEIPSGDDWVKVTGPEGLPLELIDNGNGKYDCNFVPPKIGQYPFKVKVCGNKIKETPVIIEVKNTRKPDASKCGFVGNEILVHAPNLKPEEFEFSISSSKNTHIPHVKPSSQNCYTIYYVPKVEDKNEVNVSIQVSGHHMKGSPFSQKFFEK